jgi:alpha-L-arabinofuranosidase
MKCIGNVVAWGDDNPKWNLEYPTELVDEHYYRNPSWFADRFNMYDNYPRTHHNIYVGEYAVTSQFGDIGNLNAALGEAVYMMGMENNSDVVEMASYAPIFVNENNAAWRPDMIRFNSASAMGTPSYYVQKMFPNNIGTRVIKTDMTYEMPKVVVEEKRQPVRVGLAAWNTQVEYSDPQLIVNGKTVSISDFNQWRSNRGNWKASDGKYVLTSNETPAMTIAPYDINEEKYSFKVKAMKKSGDEGFILVFGYKDFRTNNYFNVGGWGNTQNNIEQGEDGGKIQLIPSGKRNHVETGKWYDLQVDVDGDSITCFINGNVEFAARTKRSMMEGVYASTTLDGKLLIQVPEVLLVASTLQTQKLNVLRSSVCHLKKVLTKTHSQHLQGLFLSTDIFQLRATTTR